MSIYEIITHLRNTSGTNDKIAIVKQHKNNELLKRILFLENDPNTTFGMIKVPEPVLNEQHTSLTLEEALVYVDMLALRELSGNNAIDVIGNVLGKLSSEDQDIITTLIKRDLRIAMGIKNINKALGSDFLKDTPYMRCSLTTPDTLKKFKWKNTDGSAGVYSEVKMDGQYLNHIVRNLQYSAESRNGKPYDFLGVMDNDFAALATILKDDYNIIDPVFNGEAVVSDGKGGVLPRTTGNGIIQKFGKDTGSFIDAQSILAVLWDVIPLSAYKAGLWNKPRKERREILTAALAKLNSTKIKMVEFKPVTSFAEAWAYNTEVMARGDEGTIIKDERGVWKAHTSPWQLKMKLAFEVDLKVVGFNAGGADGKFANSLGSIEVESACGLLRCNMGTGFKELFCPEKDKGTSKEYSDNDVRQYIWDNQDKFMGAIVTGIANDVVKDRNADLLKLFLPVFSEWRWDKTEYDTLERIYQIKEAAIISACGL